MKLFTSIRQRFVATVMLLLLLFTVIVTWSVVDLIRENAFHAGSLDIDRDSASFKTLHGHRTEELLVRARLLASEPKVIAALGTPDIDLPTVQFLTEEIRADGNLDFMMIRTRNRWAAAAVRDSAQLSGESASRIMLPETGAVYMSVFNRDVYVVSTPVEIGGDVLGTLSIGEFVRETQFNALKPLIGSEAFICAATAAGAGTQARVMATSFAGLTDDDVSVIVNTPGADPKKSVRLTVPSTGEEFLVRSISFDDRTRAYFLKSLEPARRTAVTAVTYAVLIAVGFLLLSSIAVTMIAGAITRPLSKLVDGTEAIASGRFDVRTDIRSPIELRRLGQSFNSMAERIQALMDIEAQAKSTLEKRVLERTAELSEVNSKLVKAHAELKEQTSKLVQFEKLAAVGTLSAGIAHELNNPLLAVIGNAQLLADFATDPVMKKKSETIARNAIRCAEIVKSLLRFSRKEGPKRQTSNIHTVIDLALDLAKMTGSFKSIEVVKRYDKTVPETSVDPNLIEQVILNVSINAFEAMIDAHGKGTFVVETGTIDDRIRIRFTDDGPGMAPSVAARIFDPFFTTKVPGKGTGLGMSVAHGIVEQHGGRIHVERTGSDGTVIVVELPIAQFEVRPPTAPAEAPPGPPERSLEGRRILVVDDEVDIREIIVSVLRNAGCEIEQAEGGEEAMEKIRTTGKFDVMFVDIRMQGMDGIEFYRRQVDADPSQAARIVFVTGDTLSAEVAHFLDGTQCFSIIKPFKMKDLLTVAHTVIHRESRE